MKKICFVLVALFMVLTLAACYNTEDLDEYYEMGVEAGYQRGYSEGLQESPSPSDCYGAYYEISDMTTGEIFHYLQDTAGDYEIVEYMRGLLGDNYILGQMIEDRGTDWLYEFIEDGISKGYDKGYSQGRADEIARVDKLINNLNLSNTFTGAAIVTFDDFISWCNEVMAASDDSSSVSRSGITYDDDNTDSSSESGSISTTVYVSRNGVIHSDPHCSGMKYYTEMSYSDAVSYGYRLCSKCY